MRFISLLVAFMLRGSVLGGCMDNHVLPGESSTGVNIVGAQAATSSQRQTLGQLKTAVDGLTPANANTVRPKAQQLTVDAQTQNTQISKDLGVAAKSAAKDQRTIKSLTDPVVVRLNEFGYSALIFGILATVAGIFFSTYLGSLAAIARDGGIALGIVGLATVFLAAYLHTLFWIVGGILGALVVGSIVWLVLHRTEVIPEVESWFNKKKATVIAGTVATVK